MGGVNDIAFAHPNKQLCVVTCGDDKLIKVLLWFWHSTRFFSPRGVLGCFTRSCCKTGMGCCNWTQTLYIWRSWGSSVFRLSSLQGKYPGIFYESVYEIFSAFDKFASIRVLPSYFLQQELACDFRSQLHYTCSLFFLLLLMERLKPGYMIAWDQESTMTLLDFRAPWWHIVQMEPGKGCLFREDKVKILYWPCFCLTIIFFFSRNLCLWCIKLDSEFPYFKLSASDVGS